MQLRAMLPGHYYILCAANTSPYYAAVIAIALFST